MDRFVRGLSGKGKKIAIGTVVVLLGCGGLYRYHAGNDHLACISKVKGNNGSNILETLYLMPKDLESKVRISPLCDP